MEHEAIVPIIYIVITLTRETRQRAVHKASFLHSRIDFTETGKTLKQNIVSTCLHCFVLWL